MPKVKGLNDFIDSMDEERWSAVLEDRDSLTPEDFKKKYPAQFPALARGAKKKGFAVPRKKKNAAEGKKPNSYPEFRARRGKGKKLARSVQIEEGIYKRLKKLEEQENSTYHHAILNQLLDDALKMYGF